MNFEAFACLITLFIASRVIITNIDCFVGLNTCANSLFSNVESISASLETFTYTINIFDE